MLDFVFCRRLIPSHAPDEVSVRQVSGLPRASFRFRLTTDTLASGCELGTTSCSSGLSPYRNRPCRAHDNWLHMLKASASSGHTLETGFQVWNEYEDGYVAVAAFHMTWYCLDPQVMWIENFLSSIPHQFLRIGDDPDDIEEVNTLPDGRSYFEPVLTVATIGFK